MAWLIAVMPVMAMSDTMEGEIDYLLESIAQSQCDFVRNDKTHSAVDAADHLRRKFKRGRRYVKSTEHFIDRIASESSWTGKPYLVICDEGGSQPSRDWLYRKLAEYRQGP